MPTPARPRVAVVGAGMVGTFIAARLHQAGRHVTLCVRQPLDRLRLDSPSGPVDFAPTSVTAPDGLAPFDWLLLTVKAQDTRGTAPWVSALAGPETVVAVVQNGVGHAQRVAPEAAERTILPVLVYANLEQLGRGHVRHRVGDRLLVPAGDAGRRFVGLFAGSPVEVLEEPDFHSAAWRKLLVNLAGNPILALTGRRAEVLRDQGILELARGVLAEGVAVGQAEGAALEDADVERIVDGFADFPPDAGNSMLFDRLAGKPLEHEHITGVVVRAARRHGIPVPLNEALLVLLRGLDDRAEPAVDVDRRPADVRRAR